MANKKLAHLYLVNKVRYSNGELENKSLPNGWLYSDGRYPTHITAKDLPEWFVKGYIYRSTGYISAKDVVKLIYAPNYFFDNHLYKDDFLYVSFTKDTMKCDIPQNILGSIKNLDCDKKIVCYDHLLYGPMIVDYANAVKRYSPYDMAELDLISSQLKDKQTWFNEKNKTEPWRR